MLYYTRNQKGGDKMNAPKNISMYASENEISFVLDSEQFSSLLKNSGTESTKLPKLTYSRTLAIEQFWLKEEAFKYYTKRSRYRKERTFSVLNSFPERTEYSYDTKIYFTKEYLETHSTPTRYEFRAPLSAQEYELMSNLEGTDRIRKNRIEYTGNSRVIISADILPNGTYRVEIEFPHRQQMTEFLESDWMKKLTNSGEQHAN